MNRYFEQNLKKEKFRGALCKHQSLHRKKFNEFEVEIRWKINVNIKETFLGRVVNYDPVLTRADLFLLFRMSGECLESVVDNLENDLNYDFEILLISKFKSITYEHYLEQPMSILTRKFLRRYLEHGAEVPGCGWISVSFKAACKEK